MKSLLLLFVFIFFVETQLFAGSRGQWVSLSCSKALAKTKAPVQTRKAIEEVILMLPAHFTEFVERENLSNENLSNVLLKLLAIKKNQIQELESLAQTPSLSLLQKKMFNAEIEKLKAEFISNSKSLELLVRDLPEETNLTQLKKRISKDIAYQRTYRSFTSNVSTSRGGLVELLVSLQVESVVGTEIQVKDLLPSIIHRSELEQGLYLSEIYKKAADLEIDIVANRFKDWIEVKSFNRLDPESIHEFEVGLITKAEKLVALLSLMGDRASKFRYHIYMVGSSRISEQSIQKLKDLGVVLHFQNLAGHTQGLH